MNKEHSLKIISILIYLALSAIWVMNIGACSSTPHRIITNPELDQWDGKRMRYVNLFPPAYGYLKESEYDKIDFLQPHERKPYKYKVLSDPRGDIDRTPGIMCL